MTETKMEDDGSTTTSMYPKTALNVSNFVESILLDNGWNLDSSKEVIVVTDEASNLSFGWFFLIFIL